jgi:hypothetical protein
MAAGGPGDHPLSDITSWGRQAYGEPADGLIREIARLCSRRELYEWWEREIGWTATAALAAAKSATRYEELLLLAKQSGWELPIQDI